MRKVSFAEGEFYHIYNRGTDKRTVFLDDQDFARFLQSMVEFNNLHPVGGLYMSSFKNKNSILRHPMSQYRSDGVLGDLGKEAEEREEQLVEIIAYCLNRNHYHLLLKQLSDRGIEKFMQRIGNGYTKYFNHKYERTGVLFQGKFKAVHVDSNQYLLHVSAYVNLNFRVHRLSNKAPQFRSSWEEYLGECDGMKFCHTGPVLGQLRSKQDYVQFAENSLKGTLERRGLLEQSSLLE